MRSILKLNDNWAFLKGISEVPAAITGKVETVTLPHTWNAIDGQDGGNDYFRGFCCYLKTIEKSDLPEGEQYYLEINGANSSAEIYVNGKKMAHHDGGYSTWRVNITEVLTESNIIAIVVDNSPNEFVYPQTADFTFYGGLYRDVNLIAVPNTHFILDYFGGPGIYVTPIMDGKAAKIDIKSYITNLLIGDKVRYRILNAEGEIIAEQNIDEATAEFLLSDVRLWDGVNDPYLYIAEAAIVRGEEEIDRVYTRFGCRSFRIDPEKGFILNGREYPLRGVSRHQDRWVVGNALLPEHHKEDMDLICEMGANTIRLAHYQHDQYFYDLCDERGLVVWAEIPYISKHMADGNENTVSQMKELIVQNYNHPSIVVWGLSNEITMDGAKDPESSCLK